MRKLSAVATCALIVFACARKTTTAKTEVPAAPKITYVSNIKPIVDVSCSPCHIPSKGGKVKNLDSYDSTKKYIGAMIARVELDSTHPKFMPFKMKKPPLTKTEIAALKTWQSNGEIKE